MHLPDPQANGHSTRERNPEEFNEMIKSFTFGWNSTLTIFASHIVRTDACI